MRCSEGLIWEEPARKSGGPFPKSRLAWRLLRTASRSHNLPRLLHPSQTRADQSHCAAFDAAAALPAWISQHARPCAHRRRSSRRRAGALPSRTHVMFLPRHTSIHADHRPSLGRTSSSTSMVSLQVHESILAAKVRDMSAHFGLGLADESASTPQDADTESAPDTSSSGAVSQASAQHDLVVDGTRGKRSIDHIFVGGRPSRGQPQLSANNARDQRKAPRHSAQRTSLRGYAQARWSRHEGLCDRVLRATNVAKLEWEAKAALLHHAYPLAILLLFRAASLGSTTASQRLAHLYAYGVTRGVSPSSRSSTVTRFEASHGYSKRFVCASAAFPLSSRQPPPRLRRRSDSRRCGKRLSKLRVCSSALS